MVSLVARYAVLGAGWEPARARAPNQPPIHVPNLKAGVADGLGGPTAAEKPDAGRGEALGEGEQARLVVDGEQR